MTKQRQRKPAPTSNPPRERESPNSNTYLPSSHGRGAGGEVSAHKLYMIRKVLVANRGEIACRIIRTCAAMGIATIAVFSDADANTRHVQMADEAVRIGHASATASYLNIQALIAAAQRTGADAIHPGYGFLAENAAFASACQEAGITFIGPEPEVIARMGSKREAKLLMAAAGVPVVPGHSGNDQSDESFIAAAREIGYPVLLKASAGGGGKGMRLIASQEEMPAALTATRREALAAFGDDLLILEKALVAPRHIEFQLFGDSQGNLIHLGERECSIQRRHQKIIEETPSTALTPELRARMGTAVITVGQQLGYTNAGTVEFILDAESNFYFLEVNTRLQVEHPITELVTGLDLVRWQLLVAQGYALPLRQEEIAFTGHAIEARIYAEDPENDFLPATGPVALWRAPQGEGVRVDAGIQAGDSISPYYDPMLAKVSAWGSDRTEALRRLDYALAHTVLLGVHNNIAFLRRLLMHPAHVSGDISTAIIEQHQGTLFGNTSSYEQQETAAIAVALQRHLATRSAPATATQWHWRNNPQRPIIERFEPSLEVRLQPTKNNYYEVTVVHNGNQRTLAATVHSQIIDGLTLELDGHVVRASMAQPVPNEWWVQIAGDVLILRWQSPFPEALATGPRASHQAGNATDSQQERTDGAIITPMPGIVVAVLVDVGQPVHIGDALLILNAMKMEHTVRASHGGTITRINYRVGEQVAASAVLCEMALT